MITVKPHLRLTKRGIKFVNSHWKTDKNEPIDNKGEPKLLRKCRLI